MEKPNLNYIQQISGGDKVFEAKMLEIVKEELPLEITEYAENFKAQKWAATAENVHKLKHKISILGLEKSYQVAIDYEEDLKLGKTELRADFENILDAMVAFMAKH